MKILMLTSVYPQKDDGKYNVTPTVEYFCEKWKEQGHEVVVIHSNSYFPRFFYWIPDKVKQVLCSKMGFNFPTKESRKQVVFKRNNLSVYRLPILKLIPHGKFMKHTINRQISKIEKILEEANFYPELILSHWVNPQIELILPLGEKFNAKTSIVFHNDCSPKVIKRFDLINKVKQLDAVGCRNISYAKYVQNALELQKCPFVCYSGIPDNLAKQCQHEMHIREYSEVPEYIYVGRLIKYKNVDKIIDALHQVYQDKNFLFHIVGSGGERNNLELLIKKYRMENRILFHGQMKRDEAFKLMQRSMYFIMISENETFGMVYIEAMLAGCITIASKGGGIDGVIVDGENGYLSDEGDSVALANKIRDINSKKRTEHIKVRENAINTAINFSDSNVAEKYLKDVFNWKGE